MTSRAGLPEIEPIAGQRKPPLGVRVILKQTVLLFTKHFRSFAMLAFVPAAALTLLEYRLAPGEILGTADGGFDHTVSSSLSVYLLYRFIALFGGSLMTGVLTAHAAGLWLDASQSLARSVAAFGSVAVPFLVWSTAAEIAVLIGIELFVAPGIILVVIWCVLHPSIIVEHSGYSAFRRSWQLTLGYRWRCFALIAILLLVAGFGIFGTLEVLRDLIFSPDVADRILYLSVYAFLFGLFEAIFAISMTLAFFRLRQIKEGDIAGVFA